MQPFLFPGGESLSTIDFGAGSAGSSRESIVYVDIGKKSIESRVARDGVPIKALPINPEIFDDFFAGRPSVTQKVVSQSVPAGTPVAQGTTIHLTLAEPSTIPIGVIEGVIRDLATQPMAEVFGAYIADRPDITRILARSAESDVLTANDQEIIVETFAANGVDLTDQPGEDVAAAMTTLQAAWAFGQ
jgi:hypothetical protein